mgnify:FL=1
MAEVSLYAFQISEILTAVTVITGTTVALVIGVLIVKKCLDVKGKQ